MFGAAARAWVDRKKRKSRKRDIVAGDLMNVSGKSGLSSEQANLQMRASCIYKVVRWRKGITIQHPKGVIA